ncbi:MAG TPA: 50S ribosomal protein L13 [Anaerolineaceae bacterium]|nr:50S ribosomal protein L13 [Anaerolineaceae bacterium]
MEKTFVIKGKPETEWVLIDASGQSLGRLAGDIANILLGKNKATFTPGVLMGDNVVVINAEKIVINPKRMEEKVFYTHSNYPGGLKAVNMPDMLKKHPERVLSKAVWGMIPHNKFGRQVIKRLHVYAGNKHPHSGQDPKPVK